MSRTQDLSLSLLYERNALTTLLRRHQKQKVLLDINDNNPTNSWKRFAGPMHRDTALSFNRALVTLLDLVLSNFEGG